MSVPAESLRDQLQRVLRGEVIAVLEAAEAPVRRVDIHRQCGTAADMDDTHKALMQLARDKQVEEVRDDNGVRAWRLVGDQRPAVAKAPKRQPARKVPVLDRLIHELEEAGDWLTAQSLEYRCHELDGEQIRNALSLACKRGERMTCRQRAPRSSVYEYGLTEWVDQTTATGAAAAPEDSDVSKTQQLIDHIHRNPGVSAEGLKAATGITASNYLCPAVQAKAPKIGRIKRKAGGPWHYYPIGHEALAGVSDDASGDCATDADAAGAPIADPDPPAAATDAEEDYQVSVPEIRDFRSADFAFRSDGSLIVFPCGADPFQLGPRTFRELLSYLDAAAPMISEVLGVRHD